MSQNLEDALLKKWERRDKAKKNNRWQAFERYEDEAWDIRIRLEKENPKKYNHSFFENLYLLRWW